MPRFVILRHDWPHLHADLMLEDAGRLRSWRCPFPLPLQSEFVGEPIGDHRIEYLDYEGPVAGDRGSVVRWDFGEFTAECGSKSQTIFRLEGRRFVGSVIVDTQSQTTNVRVVPRA